MLRVVVFVSQSSNKRTVRLAARVQQPTLGSAVQVEPVVDVRGQAFGSNFRPLAQSKVDNDTSTVRLTSPESAAAHSTGLQSYLQWAGFAVGAKAGEFAFGVYFADRRESGADSAPSWMTEYTWSPARRR